MDTRIDFRFLWQRLTGAKFVRKGAHLQINNASHEHDDAVLTTGMKQNLTTTDLCDVNLY